LFIINYIDKALKYNSIRLCVENTPRYIELDIGNDLRALQTSMTNLSIMTQKI